MKHKSMLLSFVVLLALATLAFDGQRVILQIQNAGSTIATWTSYGKLNCSTGMTCTASGSTVTLTAAGSGGSVTSVAQTVPTGFAVAGSPVTTNGTLAITTTGLTTNVLQKAVAGGIANSSISDDAATISTAEFISSGNTVRAAADFTTAANTSLQTITGLSWTFPANKAVTLSFHCALNFSQATAAVAVAFGIQGATVTPTQINANGTIFTNTTTETTGTLVALASTTATNIVSATPGATATVFKAELDGTVEEPSNASAPVVNIMVSTATSGDAVTVKRGSWCSLH